VPPKEILDALSTSKIVVRVVFVRLDGVSDLYAVKIRVELANGWLLDCWEHKTPKLRRYSFHVFEGRKFIVRWDNTPHYPDLKGFPHHKHEGKKVIESGNMTVEKVLKELKTIMKQ
jgi:hypothetical protein